MACMEPYMVLGYGSQERSTREVNSADRNFLNDATTFITTQKISVIQDFSKHTKFRPV